MVKIMENPVKMDDLGGKPTIFGNIHKNPIHCWVDQFIVFPPMIPYRHPGPSGGGWLDVYRDSAQKLSASMAS